MHFLQVRHSLVYSNISVKRDKQMLSNIKQNNQHKNILFIANWKFNTIRETKPVLTNNFLVTDNDRLRTKYLIGSLLELFCNLWLNAVVSYLQF